MTHTVGSARKSHRRYGVGPKPIALTPVPEWVDKSLLWCYLAEDETLYGGPAISGERVGIPASVPHTATEDFVCIAIPIHVQHEVKVDSNICRSA